MTLAIARSRLFNLNRSGTGGLKLNVRISQSYQGLIPYTAIMTVSYRLTTSEGEVVRVRSFISRFSATALSGASRTTQAIEGSVRKNLRAFTAAVAQQKYSRTKVD